MTVKGFVTLATVLLSAILMSPRSWAQSAAIVCDPEICRLHLGSDLTQPELAEIVAVLVGDGEVAGIRVVVETFLTTSLPPGPVADVVSNLEVMRTAPERSMQMVAISCTPPYCRVDIRDELVADFTDAVFEALVSRANQASLVVTDLHITSHGGHEIVGIAIGRLVHRAAITVRVSGIGYHLARNGKRTPVICASACTSIYLAGRAGRHFSEGSNWKGSPTYDEERRQSILFHNRRYREADRLTDQQYVSGLDEAGLAYREFLRDIDVPEIVADWIEAIPSRGTRPLSPSQWKLVGEYPSVLNELVYARCGELFDDRAIAKTNSSAGRERRAPQEEQDKLWKTFDDLDRSANECVNSIMRTIQTDAQPNRY